MINGFALRLALVGLTFLAMTSDALASGYEKSIMWGGRSAGFAGIATPYTTGADALYFNPGGIAMDKVGQELTFNVSPVWSQFKGVINNTNDETTSTQTMTTPFGLMYANTIDEKWGFAVGAYTSGGSSVSYEDISFPGIAPGMDLKTDLQLLELGAGVGYRVDDRLKIGFAYRHLMASGEFAFIRRLSATSIANVKLTGLKDTKPGFSLGAQYKLDDKTQLGLRYRSETKLDPTGSIEGGVHTAGGGGTVIVPITNVSGAAHTVFPQALTLGALHKCDDMWTFLAEYGWTNYSKVDLITIDGTINGSAAPAIQQYWRDQHNYRLAAQYGADTEAWPIRFGYGWTSRVTNEDYARASFTPPTHTHTLTVGTGQGPEVTGSAVRWDAAVEYTWGGGWGNPNGAPGGATAAGTDLRSGNFAVNAYALHLGMAYAF